MLGSLSPAFQGGWLIPGTRPFAAGSHACVCCSLAGRGEEAAPRQPQAEAQQDSGPDREPESGQHGRCGPRPSDVPLQLPVGERETDRGRDRENGLQGRGCVAQGALHQTGRPGGAADRTAEGGQPCPGEHLALGDPARHAGHAGHAGTGPPSACWAPRGLQVTGLGVTPHPAFPSPKHVTKKLNLPEDSTACPALGPAPHFYPPDQRSAASRPTPPRRNARVVTRGLVPWPPS